MINQTLFLKLLEKQGIEFYTGVPDSFLNGFCNLLIEKIPLDRHIIAANEGNAVGIAAGHYFATGKIPFVYMQNSGMGNAMNPLLSLADSRVYSVPMLILIGWRGDPEINDHLQHFMQGQITLKLLDLWNIPYVVVTEKEIEQQVEWSVSTAKEKKCPVALIGKKGVFAAKDKENICDKKYELSREEAIEIILNTLPDDTIYVATTGRATRELYYARERRKESHENDFLNVGAMGHASAVALGIAQADRSHLVVCLDGDAAAIMHMGALTTIGTVQPQNFLHIVLNNGAHESVGGQPSAGHLINFTKIAEGAGYRTMHIQSEGKADLESALKDFRNGRGPYFIDMRIHKGLKGKLPGLDASYEKLIDEFKAKLQNS